MFRIPFKCSNWHSALNRIATQFISLVLKAKNKSSMPGGPNIT